jgi:hypothetical protein
MKSIIVPALIIFMSLSSQLAFSQYIDLSTGKKVVLVKHHGNGMMYNPENQRPVFLYIDPATNDTLYGRTGEKINGKIARTSSGQYLYHDDAYVYKDGEYQLKSEVSAFGTPGYKVKAENDGSIKIKDGDSKRKLTDDGDVKVKENGAKIKAGSDGALKVKDGDYKRKIDEEGNVKEKDATGKIKEDTDGSVKIKDGEYKGKSDEAGNVKEKDQDFKRKSKNGKQKMKNNDEKIKEDSDGDTKVKTKQ